MTTAKQLKLENVRSPLTDAAVRLVRMIDVQQLRSQWKTQWAIDLEDEMVGIESIAWLACSRSGLEFFYPWSAAGTSRLYEKLQEYNWYYSPDKWEHRQAMIDLRGCQRVLEVGCGRGDFLAMLRDHGIADSRGIEINLSAVRSAQERGLDVSATALGDLVGHEQFDGVCAFQVLEHVPEPGLFLADMLRALRPGGRLIISVPCNDSFVGRDRRNLLNLPPHHMSRWSIDVFRQLPSYFPMTLQRITVEPLAAHHAQWYVYVQTTRVLPIWPIPGIAAMLLGPALARIHWLRQRIRGHTLYGCFVKSDDRSRSSTA